MFIPGVRIDTKIQYREPKPFPHSRGSPKDLARAESRFRCLSIHCGGYHYLSVVSNEREAKVLVRCNCRAISFNGICFS